MINLKKIGLTALAASLVATSAFAGEMSVSGGASIGVKNTTGTNDPSTGKSFTMGNQLDFAGSGELDNGLTVSLAFELDNAAEAGGGPFDNHSVTISSDALGTFKFSGEGGSSAQGAMDAGAAGDLWDNGTGVAEIAGAAAGDNSMFYTLPEVMEGVSITASMSPGGAAQETHTSFGIAYTGVEGLTVKYAVGDSGAPADVVESTTMYASYAIGSFTVAVSNTQADNGNITTADREVDSYQIAYTVSDDISVTYGQDTFDLTGNAVDEEAEGFGISYTAGGMTLTAKSQEADGISHTTAANEDYDYWSLGLAFAF